MVNSSRSAAIALAVLGLLIIIIGYFTNNGSAASTVFLLAGFSFPAIAILLYFFSPGRSVRLEVAEAMASSSLFLANTLLSSLLIESNGIYIPTGGSEPIKIFLPLSPLSGHDIDSIRPGSETFCTSGPVKGVSLIPTGYGLYRYIRSIGAVIKQENLEGEIKDIMENGLELVPSLNIRLEHAHYVVTMSGMAANDMCLRTRSDDPMACFRTGCPICSCIACMLVAGTGKKIRIDDVKADKTKVTVSYEVLGGTDGNK